MSACSALFTALALIVALAAIPAPMGAQSQTPPPPAPPPAGSSAPAQEAPPPPDSTPPPDSGKAKKEKKDKDDAPAAIASWLDIEVVGGADKTPVTEASVYVKFTEVHKHGKDQKLEFDVKTNQEGVARAPDIPQGKVLIQIVAQGWESFGQYYEVDQDQQTIHIELNRPPRWY